MIGRAGRSGHGEDAGGNLASSCMVLLCELARGRGLDGGSGQRTTLSSLRGQWWGYHVPAYAPVAGRTCHSLSLSLGYIHWCHWATLVGHIIAFGVSFRSWRRTSGGISGVKEEVRAK